jgi:hypothetical protein
MAEKGTRFLPRFTLRDLLWLAVVVALSVGWWTARRELETAQARIQAAQAEIQSLRQSLLTGPLPPNSKLILPWSPGMKFRFPLDQDSQPARPSAMQ